MEVVGKNYIDGRWVDSLSGREFESRSPADIENLLGRFPRSDSRDVDAAVEAAARAYPSWREVSRIRRAEYFDSFVQLVKRDQEELARLVSLECGKALNEGRADVVEGIHMAQYVFGTSRMAHGYVLSSEIAEKDAFIKRKPKGEMAVITPFNFPFAIPLWLIGPSVVEGNTVVFKPAEETALVGHRLMEYFDRVGFPPGVINLVQGLGEEAGAPLVAHPEIDVVLFTGSYEVGSQIKRVCAEHSHKMAVCEMGGKNALLVLEDADLELAVRAGILSAFKTTGQRCVSAGRIIVDEKVFDEFARRLCAMAQRLRIGDPLDEGVFMGPLVSEAGMRKVEFYNELALEEGAEVLLEGGRLREPPHERGYFMSPFIYRMEPDGRKRVLMEEVFGPHVALIPVRGVEQAIEVYNATEYGLALAVITEDYRKARLIERRCEFGLGYLNLPTIGAEVHLPFGGVKKSGTGMPSAAALVDAVTHRVAWTVNHDREIKMAQGLSAEA
ncbi:MAG: aldehyde dehydrogenase family protein [Nitrospinota bacterium]